jgi:hypothetical protein
MREEDCVLDLNEAPARPSYVRAARFPRQSKIGIWDLKA